MSKIRLGERPSPEDQQDPGMKLINGLLRENFYSFQQLRDGVVWCRLLNRVYPGSIRLKSVKQRSPSIVDWYANYHLLYTSLKTLDISVDFSIRDLINGQDGEIVRAIYFFSDLYFNKKSGQRQKTNDESKGKHNDSSRRKTTSHKLQSQRTGFDFIPKLKSFFSFDKHGIDYFKLGEDSPEKNAKHFMEKKKDIFKNKQHHDPGQNQGYEEQQCNEQFQQQDFAIHMEDLQNLNLLSVTAENKKLLSDQRYQQNLIQMCIDLEKAELLMQRLWLQRRERRRMRHNLCDCSLSIGDQEQKETRIINASH